MKNAKPYERVAWMLTIACLVAQFIAAFFLGHPNPSPVLRVLGLLVWATSAILGWLPVITLRRLGEVEEGQPYVKTQQLVDRGIYGLVRHPQYLSFMLVSVGLALITQHWLSWLLAAVAVALTLTGILPQADRSGLETFGEPYADYMKRVPQVNILRGIWRHVTRQDDRS